MQTTDLVLERRDQADTGLSVQMGRATVMLTPPVSEDYWKYRVRVADGQAVVGFPKFGTIGIGFAEEEDWNTNLPYTGDAESIRRHIWHNRAPLDDSTDSAALVVRAIEMIQEAVAEDGGPQG